MLLLSPFSPSLLLLFFPPSSFLILSRIQFVQNHFVREYDPTIENSYRKQITLDNEVFMLDILDTAGQEEYSVMRDQYINSGQGFVLVYSVTSTESLSTAVDLHNHILTIKREDSLFPMVLIGNKCDLERERVVTVEEGTNLSKKWRIPFFETSAKNRLNIDQCFHSLVRQIMIHATSDSDSSKPVRPPSQPKKGSSLCILL
ncbi:MAG: GTP-binding protein [archaeon]|nr:GTP-binding protein [archaeon]